MEWSEGAKWDNCNSIINKYYLKKNNFKKYLAKLVNFCISILILKMEENAHFCHIMLYYFKKVKNGTETQKNICAVYGEGAMTDQMCQKWLANFYVGGFSLDDTPQSGRPVEVDSNQIETLIENDQHYTMHKIANILKMSRSIQLLMKMKNVSFILWKKTKLSFSPTQYMPSQIS